jgi:hypothetical protein
MFVKKFYLFILLLSVKTLTDSLKNNNFEFFFNKWKPQCLGYNNTVLMSNDYNGINNTKKLMKDILWSMKLRSHIEFSSFPYCTTVEDLLNSLKKGFRIDTPSTSSSIYKQDTVFLPDGCNFKWYF